MSVLLLGALLLATTLDGTLENPRFLSPSGEMCVVVRQNPSIADFESVSFEEYDRRSEARQVFLEMQPVDTRSQAEPKSAALYRIWPSGHAELLAEFPCGATGACEHVLVADDGYFVTYDPLRCDAKAELLTIRGPDGAVVRTLRARDVMTANDQQWLCRGDESDVRFTLGKTLRMTMLTTDGRWDDRDARHHVVDIDVRSGAVDAPERDVCPVAQRVVAEADDRLPGLRSDPGVLALESQALLDRALVRVLPDYPVVASKAHIAGTAGVHLVVGTDGKVEAAWIVKPLPFGCDEAARTAVQEWQFAPGPSRVSGVLAFRFEIFRGWRAMTTTVSLP